MLDETSAETVTLAHVTAAREQMILARETHLDSLNHRMSDPRVKRVMETLLTGEPDPNLIESEGFRLCLDLGLVASTPGNPPTVANPIYQEVLARHLTHGTQEMLPPRDTFRWQTPAGALDMDALLKDFQKFWRRNSEIWEQKSSYTEAFPHLLLMAFLQRILNGGGHIDREYAAGRGRTDLLVSWQDKAYLVEIKLLRDYDNPEILREEALDQILAYRDKLGPGIPAYLVIFDRRTQDKKLPWEQRIFWETQAGVTVIGC